MAQLSDATIASYAKSAGFSGNGLVVSIAVALAESGGVTNAVNQNRNAQGQITSTDRGLWQINNFWHKEVTDTCAFDPMCAATATYRISQSGTMWTQWSTYLNGRYKQFLSRAQVAASGSGATGTTGTNSIVPPAVAQNSPVAQANPLSYNTFDASQAQTTTTLQFGATGEDPMGAYRWIVAFLVMAGILAAIGRTRAGYAAIYYGEALILFFLFATQTTFIKEALAPLASMNNPTGK